MSQIHKFISYHGQNNIHVYSRKFKDLSSKKKFLDQTNINIEYILDFNNPLTWNQLVKRILEIKPVIVIIQWSIALQEYP